MNKRQMKKELKKQIFEAFKIVTGTCLAATDPLARLMEIKSQQDQHCKEFGLDIHPEVFDEVVMRCEHIIKELTNQ